MGVVYFSIIPTFEPSRYCKCWIVCFYYKNKAINRNMQRLVNIGLIGILGGIAKEAKASDDPKAKILVKAGMVMIAITEGLLLFSDILDYRKSRIEEKLEK